MHLKPKTWYRNVGYTTERSVLAILVCLRGGNTLTVFANASK